MSDFSKCYPDEEDTKKKLTLLKLHDDNKYKVPSINRSKINDSSATHIDECEKICYSDSFKSGPGDQADCIYNCKTVQRGFDYPIFYSSNIPMDHWSLKDGNVEVKDGSKLATQFNALDTNIIKTLITGDGQTLGKNYIYPMDKTLKNPLTGKYLDASCRDPSTGQKKPRYMFIRGIPKGDITRYAGLNLNLPIEPVDWKTGIPAKNWAGLFAKVGTVDDSGEKGGKARLKKILIELKKRCATFLYDDGVDASGEWDPVDKLRISPQCETKLKKIAPFDYQSIKSYDSSLFNSTLKGLKPVEWKTAVSKNWQGLFTAIGKIDSSGLKGGKVKLQKALTELKKGCFTFLYDVQVNASGEWDPVDKLRIPPDCESELKNIAPSVYQAIKSYDSSIFNGNLKGLIPSIVEDIVDINPISLLHKSGLLTDDSEDEKCQTIIQPLGEARYEEPGVDGAPALKNYKFEVFTNFPEQDRFKIICMFFVVVILFLNILYNIE
jgi:hypothetical protein